MFEGKVILTDIFFQLFLSVVEDVEELLFAVDLIGTALQQKEVRVDLNIVRLFVICGREDEILMFSGKEGDVAACKQLLVETGVLQSGGSCAEIAEMKGADREMAGPFGDKADQDVVSIVADDELILSQVIFQGDVIGDAVISQ